MTSIVEVAPFSDLGLAALTYSVSYGMAIFPVEPRGKKPLTPHGFHDASSHPEQIGEWWDRWPDANIGFSPGSVGLCVFDLDRPEAKDFAEQLGLLTARTLEVVTARGRHLYFRLPEGVTVGNGSPWSTKGIDIRSNGGYVLLPPSIHETGHVYRWIGELS